MINTKYFQFQSCKIAYRDMGTGQVVVLLHGFGEDSQIFDLQTEYLKNHYRLIVPDLPGSGQSAIDLKLSSSIDLMADCIAALVREITDQPVILLGHSMGGYITLAFAQKYPGRLKGFGLLHSTAFADNEEKKATRRKSIDFIREKGAFPFLQTAIPGLFAETYQKHFNDKINMLVERGKQFTGDTLVSYYEAMIDRPDRTQVLSDSKVPVLFILGTEDKAAPMDDVLQQVKLPDISYFHILENVGHMGMWEATEQMNTMILKFIKDIE